MTEYTAKKVYIKDAAGDYAIPYVNPADTNNLGVVKPDGATITAAADGTISTNNGNLRALTAYANEGELLTDAEGLAFVKNYAHSTFDRSKFTVVGSPNITTDGIASGFTTGTGIKIPTINTSKPFKIKCKFNISTLSTQCIFGVNTGGLLKILINSNGAFEWYLSTNTNNWDIVNYAGSTNRINANTSYWIEFEFTGTAYNLNASTDDRIYQNFLTKDSTSLIGGGTLSNLVIASCTSGYYDPFLGSIDLKQFSITVDGVPVFSGNKTGVDTIKASDFTVKTNVMKAFVYDTHTIYADSDSAPTQLYNADGTIHPQSSSEWQIVGTDVKYNGNNATQTPASNKTSVENPPLPFDAGVKITEDGIASGFSTSNYLTTGYSLDISKPFKICMNFITGNNATGTYDLLGRYNNQCHCFIYNKKLVFGFGGIQIYHDTVLALNTDYNAELIFDGTKATIKWWAVSQPDSIRTKYSSSITIGSGSYNLQVGGNPDHSFDGSINLNAFKIYVDGDLVYQPCLKIPYTESKTGSKIVDSIYRNRVNDMSAQFGYANYYTLDEDNGNFTLPQVELYGLIGQRTLRDSYRNGINYWELYSNRDLEQGGSCTSGVEVTFARPFADTNYVLSVPYSAKSSTAFTPTQTGDWIAKGKGLL